MSLVKVHLHGELGAKYGSLFELEVRTSIEAVRALTVNLPSSFRKEFAEQAWVIKVGQKLSALCEAELPVSSCQGEVHFIPAVSGAKDADDQILLGVGLIALAVIGIPALAGAKYAALKGFAAFAAQTSMQIGVGMALSGIAAQIMAPEDPNARETPQSRTTNEFNGPVNTMAQGRCVPVGYGRRIVGSHCISASISNEDERW